ncbi:MAG: alpha/beta hydrolase [Beijerinckiaceae bacterium]
MTVMPDRRGMLAWSGQAGLALAATGCSPLGAFNTVAGRDPDTERVADGVAYGDHPRQRLDVYVPATRARPLPVVMFIYGGSWNSGSRSDYAFVGHALASRGFLVVVPDYRLVPEVVFPGFVEDGALAARWIRDNAARLGGDAGRIALMGHSAGAHTAAMLALDPRWLMAAGVERRRIRAFVGLAGPYDFLPFDVSSTRTAFGAWPRPLETQPITFARRDAPATFLASGDADRTVKPRNSFALANALTEAGGLASVKLYPGVDHAGVMLALSVRLRDRAPVLDDVARFLMRRMGGAA